MMMRTKRDSQTGSALTLVEVLVVVAVVALLFAVFIPPVSHPRVTATRIACVNNLKQVGLAFRIFAIDHGNKFPMGVSTNKGGSMEYLVTGEVFRHFEVMSNELSTPVILACPADNRKRATNFSVLRNANISYFLGLDALETFPQMILAGDRNLVTNGVPVGSGLLVLTTNVTLGWSAAMHNNSGNVVLGDGSVQMMTSGRLSDSAGSTNRLLIP